MSMRPLPPVPHYDRSLDVSRKGSTLSSLVDSHGVVFTHARRSRRLVSFEIENFIHMEARTLDISASNRIFEVSYQTSAVIFKSMLQIE